MNFIRDQLAHVFGGRITVRQFSDFILLFEEHYGQDSDGNTLFRSVGMMRLVSDRQIELMTESGNTTVISDVPMTPNRMFRLWYAVYTWP